MTRTIEELQKEATRSGDFGGSVWKYYDRWGRPHFICDRCKSRIDGYHVFPHSRRSAYDFVPCEICGTKTVLSLGGKILILWIFFVLILYPILMTIDPVAEVIFGGNVVDQMIFFILGLGISFLIWVGIFTFGKFWERK